MICRVLALQSATMTLLANTVNKIKILSKIFYGLPSPLSSQEKVTDKFSVYLDL